MRTRKALQIARWRRYFVSAGHYENFPVASLLVPARQRRATLAIYAFARHADDIADEGDAAPAERLEKLRDFRAPKSVIC